MKLFKKLFGKKQEEKKLPEWAHFIWPHYCTICGGCFIPYDLIGGKCFNCMSRESKKPIKEFEDKLKIAKENITHQTQSIFNRFIWQCNWCKLYFCIDQFSEHDSCRKKIDKKAEKEEVKMKDFWPSKCVVGFKDDEVDSVYLCGDIDGELHDFTLWITDPLDRCFIKEVPNTIATAIYFKDKLKQLGYNVCAPKPQKQKEETYKCRNCGVVITKEQEYWWACCAKCDLKIRQTKFCEHLLLGGNCLHCKVSACKTCGKVTADMPAPLECRRCVNVRSNKMMEKLGVFREEKKLPSGQCHIESVEIKDKQGNTVWKSNLKDSQDTRTAEDKKCCPGNITCSCGFVICAHHPHDIAACMNKRNNLWPDNKESQSADKKSKCNCVGDSICGKCQDDASKIQLKELIKRYDLCIDWHQTGITNIVSYSLETNTKKIINQQVIDYFKKLKLECETELKELESKK